MSVSFTVPSPDFATIGKVVDRYERLAASLGHTPQDRMSTVMDLCACHANGNPIRWADLLAADDSNFAHDVFGIIRHVDRDTGVLGDFFSPRFTDRAAMMAAA